MVKKVKGKRMDSYTRYQIMSSKEYSGVYKFPGEFLVLGLIAILVELLIEHPVVTPVMTITAMVLFAAEAYFLFRRYVYDNLGSSEDEQ